MRDSGEISSIKEFALHCIKIAPRDKNYFEREHGFKHQTITPRLSELCDEGLIFDFYDENDHVTSYMYIGDNPVLSKMQKRIKNNKRWMDWVKTGLNHGFIKKENGKIKISRT